MTDLLTKILHAVSAKSYVPLKAKALFKRLNLGEGAYPEFRRAVRELIRDGRLVFARNNTLRAADAHGTLTGIYAHLTDIKPSVRAKLEADRESAFFCEKMATLVCDISLPVSLDRLLLRDIPTDAVVAFLRSMDFTLLERRFRTLLTSQYGRSICTPSSIAVPAAKGEGQMAMF